MKRLSTLIKVRAAIVIVACLLIQMLVGPGLASAAGTPGTNTTGRPLSTVRMGSLEPIVSETGKVSLSVDGQGTLNQTGTLRVQKPAGATVRDAFLAAASTGFTGFTIPNGALLLNGTGVTWNIVTNSSISSVNHWANVTSIIKPLIDTAPTGISTVTVTEGANTLSIDGEILAVVFDDPNQTTDNTIVLMFGAQNVAGDTFAIRTAAPINTADPNLLLDMSLGISYGFQQTGACGQFSIVNVDNKRLTSSAGGQDDGSGDNGALLTVGGIGDTDANPTNPNDTSCPQGARSDDELYDLRPFVTNGDSTISVFTQNPSNDDNIFFSSLFLRATTAIVGEGIVLAPLSATNPVGGSHTVTATVQDANGVPIVGRTVTFSVVSGPNAGKTGTAATNSAGQASFTYSDTNPGTDTIQATFVNSQGATEISNMVTKVWTATDATAPTCTLQSVGTDSQGRKIINILTQDTGSGLGQITVTQSTNASISVPPFAVATTAPVIVTATKVNQSASSEVALQVIDVAGNVTNCDPILTQIGRGDGASRTDTFHHVARSESKVYVYNDTPGLTSLRLTVDGRSVMVNNLKDGETRLVDVARLMKRGDNTITLTAVGKPDGSATVLIADS
jgi:hypothetical protein